MTYTIDYGMGYYHPKLGDAIVYCSAFKHFKNVRWRHKIDKHPVPDIWKQVMPMFKPYNLKVQYGKPTRSDKNFMREMAKENMKIAEATFTPVPVELPDRYVTIQGDTGFAGRDESIDRLTEYAEGLPVVNLDKITAIRDSRSVSRLMTVQQRAEFHIGPDSGCAWSALAVRTPIKVIEADENKLDMKRLMMHKWAINLMQKNDDVEIIKRR